VTSNGWEVEERWRKESVAALNTDRCFAEEEVVVVVVVEGAEQYQAGTV